MSLANRKHACAWTIAMLLAGCGAGTQEAGSTEGTGDARSDMPPIHVDQIVEMLHDGNNEQRSNYLATVRDCQAAGLPTRPLTDADIELLGTTRYELWFDRDQEVVRTREWRLAAEGPAPSCQFHLELTGAQEMQSARGSVQIDLATGERSESPADPDGLARVAAEPDEGVATQGFKGPERRSVAGQPCNEWTEDEGRFRQCVWSGGARWGFTPGGLQDYRPSRDVIVLEQSPLDGNGVRVTTRTMTVGRPFDQAALETPRIPATGK